MRSADKKNNRCKGTGNMTSGEFLDYQTDKTQQQCQERRRHGAMVFHGGDEQNEGKNRPGQQEKTQVRITKCKHGIIFHDFGIFAGDQHETERNPECSVAGKCTKTKIVADLEFHEAGYQLGRTTKNQTKPDYGSEPAPTQVVALEYKRRQTKSC